MRPEDDPWGFSDKEEDPLLLNPPASPARQARTRNARSQSRRVWFVIVVVTLLCVVLALVLLSPIRSVPRDAQAIEAPNDVHENDPFTPVETPDDDIRPLHVEQHAALVQDGLLDTRPPTPALLSQPGHERFIAYLPHSGLHNQRIELQNALLLAHLTNRTLLVPLARLGHPLPWKHFDLLSSLWHRQQKSTLTRCRAYLPRLEAHEEVKDTDCKYYASYTQVSWEFLVDLEHLRVPVRLIERDNLDHSWFSRADGMNISQTSIHSFEDPVRYSWRIYDDQDDHTNQQQYKNRLDLEALRTPPYSQYDLLEFGSLFGSSRWILRNPEHKKMLQDIEASLTFQMPLLDEIADAIEQQLGGRANFVGLHLRVGDGGFKRNAVKSMQNVFRQLCTRVFALHDAEVDSLIAASRKAGPRTRRRVMKPTIVSHAWSSLDGSVTDEAVEEVISSLEGRHLLKRESETEGMPCRGVLHTDPELAVLNTRVYVATDSPRPYDDAALAPFRHALPCLSFLSDFRESVPALPGLGALRSRQDGVKVSPLLMPILEAMIAARGRVVLGTKGSTFSRYVTKALHDHYWPARHSSHRSRAHRTV